MNRKFIALGLIGVFIMLLFALRLRGISEQQIKALTVSIGSSTNDYVTPPIVVPSFPDGGVIQSLYTCDDRNTNPEVKWAGAPDETASFAIIMEDPAAKGGVWTHWLIYNIPPKYTAIAFDDQFINTYAQFGKNGWGNTKYEGPCPPQGEEHTYIFKVYALDIYFNDNSVFQNTSEPNREQFLKAIEGHVIAQGQTTGKYKRAESVFK